jgi:hypothetical protein
VSEPCTLTQDDVNDGPFTEFNEGFVSYMFGQFLHENPYCGTDYNNDEAVKSYVMWHDGWMSAKETYPDSEPKDES